MDVTKDILNFLQLILLIFLLHIKISFVAGYSREYCNEEFFTPDCGAGKVILIEEALYGRMKLGRCIARDLGYLGCQKDVSMVLHRSCSGRQRCSVQVLDSVFHGVPNCYELKLYLHVIYQCIEVLSPGPQQCTTTNQIFAPPPPSYLTNNITQNGCGTQAAPWVIQSNHPTQKIQFKLLNLAPKSQDAAMCLRLGTLREEGQADHVICDSSDGVIMSRGVQVQLELTPASQLDGNVYLIKYQSVGCEPPRYNKDVMWMKPQPDQVTLGCFTHSSLKWTLHCRDGHWQGLLGNCTGGATGESHSIRPSSDTPVTWWSSVPRDLTIYVLIGIGILLLFLLVLLVVWAVGRKRRPQTLGMYGSPLQTGLPPPSHMYAEAPVPVWSINKPLGFTREAERLSGRYVNRPLPPLREEPLNSSSECLDDYPTWARRNNNGPKQEHIYYELDPTVTGYQGTHCDNPNCPDIEETSLQDTCAIKGKDSDGDMDALIPVTPSSVQSERQESPKLATINPRGPRSVYKGSPHHSPGVAQRLQKY